MSRVSLENELLDIDVIVQKYKNQILDLNRDILSGSLNSNEILRKSRELSVLHRELILAKNKSDEIYDELQIVIINENEINDSLTSPISPKKKRKSKKKKSQKKPKKKKKRRSKRRKKL